MNTNTKELNINEMEQVNGGSSLSADQKKMQKTLCGRIAEACMDAGKKAYVFGKIAISWISGLFD